MSQDQTWRYRIHFHKTNQLRYIGHLDLHRTIERTLRRAKLPLAFSQGFNPRIKLNLSPALPLGCSSVAELADIWLIEERETQEIHDLLLSVAPPGLKINSIETVDSALPSIQSAVVAIEYEAIPLDENLPFISLEDLTNILKQDEIIRSRRGKTYDLRPLIIELNLAESQPPCLSMSLSAGEGKTGRPEEVLLALGVDPKMTHITRTRLTFQAE
jgi:radical SAM-linked protein